MVGSEGGVDFIEVRRLAAQPLERVVRNPEATVVREVRRLQIDDADTIALSGPTVAAHLVVAPMDLVERFRLSPQPLEIGGADVVGQLALVASSGRNRSSDSVAHALGDPSHAADA